MDFDTDLPPSGSNEAADATLLSAALLAATTTNRHAHQLFFPSRAMDMNQGSYFWEDSTDEDEPVEIIPNKPSPTPTQPQDDAVVDVTSPEPPAAPSPPPPPRPPTPPPPPQPPPPPPDQSTIRALLHPSLLTKYPDLAVQLAAAAVPYAESIAGPPLSVHWAPSRPLAPLALVWAAADVVRLANTQTLIPKLEAACDSYSHSSARLSLLVTGKAPAGLEQCLGALQLEMGMCARRAPNARELADVLANHTAAIAKAEAQAEPAAAAAGSSSSAAAGPSTAPDFLAGLTAHDVLRN